MNNDDFDLYDSEEEQLNATIMEAEDEYESLKDRVHELYTENIRLKQNKPYLYILKEDLNEIIAKHFDRPYIAIKDLLDTIEELDMDVQRLEEEKQDILEDRDENWVRKPISEQVDICDRDFV